uniref:Uncharacterized protein n=1 Tax=viral metagenome TaxID=1070528 RepID=A0A6M3IGV5_9ZZZZ
MKVGEKRAITVGAMRWLKRQASTDLSWEEVQKALDDFARAKPDTVAAEFWKTCSDHQYKLLRRDWKRLE